MKVYIAGPLFNEPERRFNAGLRDAIRSWGFETYLPQEDGGIAFDEIRRGGRAKKIRQRIFAKDIQEIKSSDIFLAILDGRVPDEGMCVELGMAFTLKKRCIGYKTDTRTMDKFGENIMVDGCLETTVGTLAELRKYLQSVEVNVGL